MLPKIIAIECLASSKGKTHGLNIFASWFKQRSTRTCLRHKSTICSAEFRCIDTALSKFDEACPHFGEAGFWYVLPSYFRHLRRKRCGHDMNTRTWSYWHWQDFGMGQLWQLEITAGVYQFPMPQQCSNDGLNCFGQVPMGDWWYHSSATCCIGDGSKVSASYPRYLDIQVCWSSCFSLWLFVCTLMVW